MKNSILLLTLFLSQLTHAQTFTLKSTDLGGQASIKHQLKGIGCNGDNISPQLFGENPPAGTKSFAVAIYDDSEPTGSGWWHWVIFDIDSSTTELKADAGNTFKRIAPKNELVGFNFGQNLIEKASLIFYYKK